MRKTIVALAFVLLALLSGCVRYVTWDSSETVLLVNKGDKITRREVEPHEVIVNYDGEVVSEAEIRRLRKIEEDYYLLIDR